MALGEVFCCDSDALISLSEAGLLSKLRGLVKSGNIKVPEGVYRELSRKTDKLAKRMQGWNNKFNIVVPLDHKAKEVLPHLEIKFGPPFSVPGSGKTYAGFWKSASGRKSVDSQIVALAKTRKWIAISNDDSVHGACMLEDVLCRRWEEIGRRLLALQEPRLPGF